MYRKCKYKTVADKVRACVNNTCVLPSPLHLALCSGFIIVLRRRL